MRTQEESRTAVARQPRLEAVVSEERSDLDQRSRRPAPPAGHEKDQDPAAPSSHGEATRAQPCPERIWWFGVLVGGPLMLIGFLLTLTLVGAPLGIPLWAAGLGLMLSPRPCRD
jgi:hypothetical protein